MWRRIPSSKPTSHGGISTIKIPANPEDDPKNPETQFRSVVDLSEIESLLLERNRKHFSQTRDTPLASPFISKALGWGGNTDTSEHLLDGSLHPSRLTTDRFAQDIFHHCRQLNKEIDPSISLEDFKDFYLHWNVGTSTSPSGRHLSHLHALFQPTGLPDDTREITQLFNDTKESLWLAHYTCINYSTRFGYC